MDLSSAEAQDIRTRLFRGELIDRPNNYTIQNNQQRYFRTIDNVVVRHDLQSDLYFVLNASTTRFVHSPTPLAPDSTGPFNEDDLLREPGWVRWAYNTIKSYGPQGAASALGGGVLSAGIIQTQAYITGHAAANSLGAAIGAMLGVPPPAGAAVAGAAVGLTNFAIRRARNPNPFAV